MNGIPWQPYTYRGTGQDTLTAWMDNLPERTLRHPGGFRIPKPCGTTAAYQRHRRKGERPCDACLEAMRLEYQHSQRRETRNARRREAA